MSRIVFADDDDGMRNMVTDMLVAAGHDVQAVVDGRSAIAAIRADPPDLVVLDYRMGSVDGLEVCRTVKQDPGLEHVPVLILTAESDVEDRIKGFAAGANDYLPKPFDARELLARINALLRLSEQGRELNPTTGLPGGTAIDREFERRRRKGESFSLCYLDLDYFKPFNDRFGFPMANGVIEALGRILRRLVSDSDHFAGHIGGDDFVFICDRGAARPLLLQAQTEFHSILEDRLPEEVMRRGTYRGLLRNGIEDDVPLTRITCAIMHLDPTSTPPLNELGELAAEMKRKAKDAGETGMAEVEVGGSSENGRPLRVP
jgi:CheY-like chemotaxis protein